MPEWTSEQLSAINSFREPVIVSAAAGSGKTAVLVERTIRILSDKSLGVPADSILAVTFTNDAADQMREKLANALEEAGDKNPDSDWLQSQQALLGLASICTINSFCFDMVRNNLIGTGFRPGLRIMEKAEADMISQSAIDEVFDRAYLSRPEDMKRLLDWFSHEGDGSLKSMVLKLWRFERSIPFRRSWEKTVLDSYKSGGMTEKALSALREEVMLRLRTACGLARSIDKLLERLNYHSGAKKVLSENVAECFRIYENADRLDYYELSSYILEIGIKSLVGARQKKQEKESSTPEENAVYELLKSFNSGIREELEGVKRLAPFFVGADDDSKKSIDCISSLFLLADELDSEVYSRKQEKNAIDFSDSELLLVSMLVSCDDDGRLARTDYAKELAFSGRYRLIIIDEFQDVNNLQEVIFKAISDSDDLSTLGENVFCVGDVKQAIYRFRQANPKIFLNTREMARAGRVREILLSKNFRSRPSVLDFSNYVFSSLMSDELGEVTYDESEMLVPGRKEDKDGSPTEIILCNKEETSEYQAIARRIRGMIESGVRVPDGDGERPCCAGDFCVLTRTNSHSGLEEAFREEGLGIMSQEVSGYLGSREISLVLSLLSVAVSPMREVPLASLLLSPILGFSDDDIASLRLYDREKRLYQNLLSLSHENGPLANKCLNAVELIRRLRLLSAGLPLTKLIQRIYDTTDIYSTVSSAYSDSELEARKRCANLNLLLEYAKSYESTSGGLAGFLSYIDHVKRTGGDFEEAITVTESRDAVNVKTIHKAKGLEYPFVFLCQLSKRFNLDDISDRLLLSFEQGVGIMFNDYETLSRRRTVFHLYLSGLAKKELLSEELRLLYVAMTRARERLFLVMELDSAALETAKRLKGMISSHLVPASVSLGAVCQRDWILASLVKHPGFKRINGLIPFEGYLDSDRDYKLPYIIVTDPPGKLEPISARDSEPSFSPELYRGLLREFSRELYIPGRDVEAKVSVSELTRDDSLNFFPEVPSLEDTVRELSYSQRGTLMHRFMQLADYERAGSDLDGEISRLRSAGAFTEAEAASLNKKGLTAFFRSDIYSRLKKSRLVMREKSFLVKLDDINAGEELKALYKGTDGMLQGIADCIFLEEDGYVIIDYKTDRARSVEELKDAHSMQLLLYKAAFDLLLDKPVKSCYIYSYRLGDGIEVDLR